MAMQNLTGARERLAKVRMRGVVAPLIYHALDQIDVWVARRQQRRQLARLPDYLLHDIGVTPSDVFKETQKPFWQP
jgi:uncharacterized protein YjiS (DUF1127 family)